jgi:hypothetical protein
MRRPRSKLPVSSEFGYESAKAKSAAPQNADSDRDEDEWRKRVTAKLMGSPTHLLIDNLKRRLDSAAIASAITSPTWEDRVLGESTMIRIPVRCVWLATGNNPLVSAEIARRTVRIRLDAKRDQPWLRSESEFRHPNLRVWVKENRGRLVWAALTLIRAWLVAGRPFGKRTLGMFESWAKTIGGILEVASIPGFLGNLQEFYESSDFESSVWRGFIAAWWDRFKDETVAVADVWGLIGNDAPLPLGDGGERAQKTRLGKLLADARDRVYAIDAQEERLEVRLEAAGVRHSAKLWKLAYLGRGTWEPRELISTPACATAGAHARAREGGLEKVPNVPQVPLDESEEEASDLWK